MMIVSDIGGTYVRFAQSIDGTPTHIKKYKADDYTNFTAALSQYCADCKLTNKGDILIATAGYEEDGIWKITNNQDWEINPATIKEQGWGVPLILNDFEAGTYSLRALTDDTLKTFKAGKKNNNSLCLIGAGTGLGLGYNHGGHIQKTHGGHMPIASLNDDHGKAIKEVRTTLDRAIIFEDIVSGPGLQKLRAMYDAEKASNLFHEFLGIFAATALISGHAYGGLYLTGGVITNLIDDGAFDYERFNNALCFDAVPCVKEDLGNTPIHYITDPFPALKGLIHAKSLSNN